MLYCFILGHNPTLSIVEILNVFSLFKIDVQIISFSEETLLLDIKSKFLVDDFFSRLGGAIKIGEIKKDYAHFNEINIDEILKLFNIQKDKKVYFGLSLYNLDAPSDKQDQGLGQGTQPTHNNFLTGRQGPLTLSKDNIKKLAIKIKRTLQKSGLKVRWVISQEKNLSSVVVEKNKLIKQGAEILILAKKNKLYLGKTLVVQEFKKYSQRDYNRPFRDTQKGMLPPKLAQIMINLGQIKKDQIILDPFCGSGTILQEAILMGYKNIIGSDIDLNSVEATKKNLEWLFAKFKACGELAESIQNSKFKINILKCDARDLSQKIPFNSVDAIITEPYLGPTKNIQNINKIIQELSKLYLKSFYEFKKILKKDGMAVIIFPAFKAFRNDLLFLPILDRLKNDGWKIDLKLPIELLNNPIIKITSRNSIIYSRPDQRVFREIFIFRKT